MPALMPLGANTEGAVFYAMKEVRGTPWNAVIKDKSLDENLDILMRIADAVAFAHSKGIIHRDLKPSNVMLGDYGRYAKAVFGYEEAGALWPEREAAKEGAQAARLAYAECAFMNRDFDLAESLLDTANVEHRELAQKVAAAKRERDARRQRVKMLTYGTTALAATIIIVLAAAFVWVQLARKAEQSQRLRAEKALADYEAEQARRQTDREASAPSLVRSAKAYIEQNDFDTAGQMTRAAIDYDPSLAEARLIHALLLFRAARYGEAREASALALRLSPEDRDARRAMTIAGMAASGGADAAPLSEIGGIAGRLGQELKRH